jgi:uncharacterized lipoprotein YbaY
LKRISLARTQERRLSDSDSSQQVVHGQIVFDDDAPAFSGATLYVTLEDVTYADSEATTIGRLVKKDVAHDPNAGDPLTFEITCEVPDDSARYNVRAHIDVDGSGQISRGDYVNTQSYPVITRGHPSDVSMRVSRIK